LNIIMKILVCGNVFKTNAILINFFVFFHVLFEGNQLGRVSYRALH